MLDKNMENLKRDYDNISIPDELEFVVKKALKEAKDKKANDEEIKVTGNSNNSRKIKIAAASIAALLVFTIAGVNSSPAFAATLSKVPIIGSIIKVINFREFRVNDSTYNMTANTPAVQGLKDKKLEKGLNEKYVEENKKLYESFKSDIEELKKNGGGHMGVDSGYEVKTDNEQILSIGRYVVNTVGSSSTTFKYDTIDKKKEVLITLPSLFKDDRYINIISENIKKQMIEQNRADKDKFYWVSGIEKEATMGLFEKISKDQSFYINSTGKLVISFDKYEVAPGYMGVIQFVIPTEILSDVLVSNEYIK